MHILEDLSYVLEDMIEPIAQKQDISPTELDNVYKAVKTMNYIETIKAMKEYGNSNDYSYAGGSSYARNSRNSRYSYEGNSRAGRDSMGRYTSRNYSRDGGREQMISELERMMDDAGSNTERQAIRECIRRVESDN